MDKQKDSIDYMQEAFKFVQDFDVKEVFSFCVSHKVEVLLQDDMRFHVFVDYKKGDRSVYSSIHPLSALWGAVKTYKKL